MTGVPTPGKAGRGLAGFADRALDRLSSLGAIVAFWSVYALVFALLRLGRSSFLPVDDSISAEVMQRIFLPAYAVSNPPLYEWFLWAVQEVLGPGVAGHVLLRGVLIVVIGVAMYETVRGLTRDRRLAAAASIGLLGFYATTWHFHDSLTQSLFVFVLLLAMIRLLDSFCRTPNAPRALALGLAMGLGVLAKWSFALPVLAAWIVLLLDPRARRAGLVPFALIAAALALTVAPTLIYLFEVKADLAGASAYILYRGAAESHFVRVLQGLGGVVVKTAVFFVPAFIFVIAAYARLRAWPSYSTGDASARLVTRFVLVQALVLVAAVLFAGIVNVTERYVYTLAVPIALAFFLSVAVPPVRDTVLRFIVGGSFLTMAAVILIKLGMIAESLLPDGRAIPATLPYPALAQELSARGLASAAFVAPDHKLAGNLGALLPEAIVVARSSDRLLPPRTYDPARTCVLIWPGDSGAAVPRALQHPALPQPLPPAGVLDIAGSNGGIGAPRHAVWHAMDLGPDAEICRAVIGVK